jgi:hypothetical protein
MVILNKKAKSIQGLENAMLQLLVSFLTVAVYVGLRQGFFIDIAAASWLPILILGIVNTGMGCYLYFSSIGYQRSRPSSSAVIWIPWQRSCSQLSF